MLKGIIDVGSNSIKFFLGRLGPDGTVETVIDENDIASLGEGLRETGNLIPQAMKRNSEAITRFAEKARAEGAGEIVCVGTMALRNAKNTPDFVKLVKETANVDLQVIAGEEEARLSYLAVLSGLGLIDGKLAIFDTGGGSTEFIFGKGSAMDKRFSVDMGAIRITEKHFKADRVSQTDVITAIAEVDSIFGDYGINGRFTRVVGIGGAVTSMGAVKHKMAKYDPGVIQGSTLTLADIDEQIETYSSKTIEERKAIVGLQPKRAEVILAGACIIKVILGRLGVTELTISDRGLRHGLAFDLFAKN
ncbi:MAG: Ppx/GppA family phosphatase [Defluviitaleaceae bacterium]|nr:Ppx/GppA family phosphatase [Defluviitaleaceae bacterium]